MALIIKLFWLITSFTGSFCFGGAAILQRSLSDGLWMELFGDDKDCISLGAFSGINEKATWLNI